MEPERKICHLAHHTPLAGGLVLSPGQLNHPQSLMDYNFAVL